MCDMGINPDTFNPRILYMFRKKFSDEDKVNYHCHDFPSIIYVISGSCTYNISDSLYQVRKGDIIICNPGVYHGKMLAHGDEITEFHVSFNNISIRNLPKDHLVEEGVCPLFNFPQHEQDILKCCNDILLEQERKDPGCELMLKSLLMRLIILFLRGAYTSEKTEESNGVGFDSYEKTNVVNTILTFINENYMKDITLDRISKNMYLSPAYISKVFKEEVGESPINYLIKIRLSKARNMLEEGRLPVKTIAKSVGYHDAYYFSKLYKKYYGTSPSNHKPVAALN